jgi:hypothetical protein
MVTGQEQQLLRTFVAAMFAVVPGVTVEQASLIEAVVDGMLRERADDLTRGRQA